MTPKKPRPPRRPPSINDHFRREWLFHGLVWVILIVLGLLSDWWVPWLQNLYAR